VQIGSPPHFKGADQSLVSKQAAYQRSHSTPHCPSPSCRLGLTIVMSDDMAIFTLSRRRSLRRVLLGFGLFAVIGLILRASWSSDSTPVPQKAASKAFIVASMKNDNTDWIQENLPGWDLIRYVVDDPKAKYTVPRNKGREAMVYLT